MRIPARKGAWKRLGSVAVTQPHDSVRKYAANSAGSSKSFLATARQPSSSSIRASSSCSQSTASGWPCASSSRQESRTSVASPSPPGSETSSTSQRRWRTKASRPGSGAGGRADDGGWPGSGAGVRADDGGRPGSGADPPLGADLPAAAAAASTTAPGAAPAAPRLLMRAILRPHRFARIGMGAGFEPVPNTGELPLVQRGVRSASGDPPWSRHYRIPETPALSPPWTASAARRTPDATCAALRPRSTRRNPAPVGGQVFVGSSEPS